MSNSFAEAARRMGLGTSVRPYRVGTSVRARVGAPALAVPQLGETPIEYAPTQYSSGGNSYFGFGQTVVPAGARSVLQFNPIRPFEPQELRCPSTVIGLLLEQINIQGVQFFANKAGFGVPIEMFSEVSRLKGLEAATINPDTGVEMTIFNPTGGDLVFSGCFRGTQVRI